MHQYQRIVGTDGACFLEKDNTLSKIATHLRHDTHQAIRFSAFECHGKHADKRAFRVIVLASTQRFSGVVE